MEQRSYSTVEELERHRKFEEQQLQQRINKRMDNGILAPVMEGYSPLFIYIAGPLNSSNLVSTNIHQTIKIADVLRADGFMPFVPHLDWLWELVSQHRNEEFYMEWDFAWLTKCDAVFRMEGASKGADREVAYAQELNIPVFYDMFELHNWAKQNRVLITP